MILESPVNGVLPVSESGSESAYVKLLKVSLMFISVGSKRDRSCSVNGLTRTATVIDDCLVSGIFDVDIIWKLTIFFSLSPSPLCLIYGNLENCWTQETRSTKESKSKSKRQAIFSNRREWKKEATSRSIIDRLYLLSSPLTSRYSFLHLVSLFTFPSALSLLTGGEE